MARAPRDSSATRPAAVGLKPRRVLFIVLGIILVMWICGLIVLYALTVYPQRDAAGRHRPGARAVEGG